MKYIEKTINNKEKENINTYLNEKGKGISVINVNNCEIGVSENILLASNHAEGVLYVFDYFFRVTM